VDGQSIARQRLSEHVNKHATAERVAAPRPASLVATQRRCKHISAAVGRHVTMFSVRSLRRLYNATLVIFGSSFRQSSRRVILGV
jgi:hypothetical protein